MAAGASGMAGVGKTTAKLVADIFSTRAMPEAFFRLLSLAMAMLKRIAAMGRYSPPRLRVEGGARGFLLFVCAGLPEKCRSRLQLVWPPCRKITEIQGVFIKCPESLQGAVRQLLSHR